MTRRSRSPDRFSGRALSPRVRAASLPLSQYANPRFRTKKVRSAISLISTVPDDTFRRQVHPSLSRHSPVNIARAVHRISRFPNRILGPVVSLPQRAMRCASRAIRREVLFALKQTGKGSRAPSRRRNSTSSERCK
jgi:hypothetical protein